MQQRWVLLVVVAVSWIFSCQANLADPVLALGALAILKGAAIAGYKLGSATNTGYYRHRPYYSHHRWGREAENDPRKVEDALLASVTQLDPDSCLLKLLCLARATPVAARTHYQASLVHMFAGITQAPTPAGIPYVQALLAGDSSGKADATCHASYPSCKLSEDILHGMLVQAWGAADQQQITSAL